MSLSGSHGGRNKRKARGKSSDLDKINDLPNHSSPKNINLGPVKKREDDLVDPLNLKKLDSQGWEVLPSR